VEYVGACLLLLALFAQAMFSLPLTSPSFDEPYDVARGYAYARGTDLRMQQEHPVLIDGLGGLALLLMPELTTPDQIPGWSDGHLFQFSQHLLWRLGHDVDKLMFLARLPVVLLAMVLGAVVYRWGVDMFGPPAALLALALLVFNPNIVAHARVLSTDLGAACFATVALYLWWRWVRAPSAGRLAVLAGALGLALAAKTSNLSLLILVAVLTAMRALEQRWRWSRVAIAVVVMGGGALLVLWTLYRFEFRPAPEWTGVFPVPAASYWEALGWLQEQMQLGRPAFLAGRYTIWGWWYYFIVVFLIKTPLPFLILLGLALVLWATRQLRQRPVAGYVLWSFPLAYFVTSAFSTLNLGYRHILPAIPAMTLLAASVVVWPGLHRVRASRIILAGLLAWLVIGACAIFPYHLAYFNELVGGPSNGYRWLVDSNLDWGQGLKHLKHYVDEQDIDELWLAYFGSGDPDHYGIPHRDLFAPGSGRLVDGFGRANPPPGWYAISATVLQGPYAADPDMLDWFRRREPQAKVGYSILVYRVEPDPKPPSWLGLCYAPDTPLDDAEIDHLFALDALRVVGFDCDQAWVYPAHAGPGWYLVPASRDGVGSLAAEALEGVDTVYQQRGLRGGPAFTVYQSSVPLSLDLVGFSSEAWTSPVLAPAEGDPRVPLALPADLGGQVKLLGFGTPSRSVDAGQELEITTAWQVRAKPDSPEMSVFVHLIDAAQAVSVGDGLGFPAVQWSPGDVFIQRNRLPVPADTAPGRYWIQVGAYSLVTGARLPVLDTEEPAADRILLAPLEVTD
jgi:hypothetical protein